MNALRRPIKNLGRLSGFVGRRVEGLFRAPEVRVHQAVLEPEANRLGRLTARFATGVERLLRRYREEIVDREYQLGRIGDSAMELYVSACVLKRMESLLSSGHDGHDGHAETAHAGPSSPSSQLAASRYYLQTAERRIRANLAALWDNDDEQTTATADLLLP